jgi:hypothetical protein
VAGVVVVAALLLGAGLGRAPFDDPGEGMHAEIARELFVSRDPFGLTLSGVPYVDKPPLLYTLIALVFSVAGPGELAARAVSALAAVAAVAATAWLGCRLLGAAGGIIGGVGLLTCVGFFAYGRYVRPETLFVAAIAWGFALMLVGLMDDRRPFVVAGVVAFAVAALAKDALAVVLPLAVIGLALLLSGQIRPVRRWLPWPAVAIAAVAAVGWWILAEVRTPGFIWYTVVDNHVRNVARTRLFPDEDVPLGALQFLLVASLAAAPWIVAAVAAIVSLARRRAWRDPDELPWVVLALWMLGVFGGAALSSFRLPHYALPAYPALALLAARAWMASRSRALVVASAVCLAALALACGLAWWSDGSVFMSTVMEAADVASRKTAVTGASNPLPPWSGFADLLGHSSLVFALGTLVAVIVAARRPRLAGIGALPAIVTMLALMPLVAGGVALVAGHRAVRDLATEVGQRAAATDVVAHEGPLENSGALEWYSGRRPVIIDGRRSVLGFGATLPDVTERFWDAATVRARWGGAPCIWVVTTRDPQHSVVAGLSGTRLVARDGERWLYVSPGACGASSSATVAKP